MVVKRLMTKAEYAAHRGCGVKEVRQALALGRIALEPDGRIAARKADKAWAASTNPASAKKPGMKPGETTLNKKDGGTPTSFVDARVRSETAKARLAELRVKEKEGDLIDARWAKEAAFTFTRRIRDHLQAWPSRVAALMAAEIGVDAHLMEATLDKHVHDLLRSMANVDVEAFAGSLSKEKGRN